LCACTPPLDEVLRLWDFLLAFGVHLNVLCVIAQLLLIRDDVMASSRYSLLLWHSIHVHFEFPVQCVCCAHSLPWKRYLSSALLSLLFVICPRSCTMNLCDIPMRSMTLRQSQDLLLLISHSFFLHSLLPCIFSAQDPTLLVMIDSRRSWLDYLICLNKTNATDLPPLVNVIFDCFSNHTQQKWRLCTESTRFWQFNSCPISAFIILSCDVSKRVSLTWCSQPHRLQLRTDAVQWRFPSRSWSSYSSGLVHIHLLSVPIFDFKSMDSSVGTGESAPIDARIASDSLQSAMVRFHLGRLCGDYCSHAGETSLVQRCSLCNASLRPSLACAWSD